MKYYMDSNNVIYYKGKDGPTDALYKWGSSEYYCEFDSKESEEMRKLITIYAYVDGEFKWYPALDLGNMVQISLEIGDNDKITLQHKSAIEQGKTKIPMAFSRERLVKLLGK